MYNIHKETKFDMKGGNIMAQFSLKELRARHNLSQEKLANLVGITTRTIASYESDIANLRKASYQVIEKIAEVLEVEVKDIFLG